MDGITWEELVEITKTFSPAQMRQIIKVVIGNPKKSADHNIIGNGVHAFRDIDHGWYLKGWSNEV